MKANQAWAEAVGTFALVFAGCAAIVVNDTYAGVLGHGGICLVFGLVVMAMIYSVGNISGAHLNPAVTLGFYFAGRLRAGLLLPYIASQAAGAMVAGLLLRVLFPEHLTLGATIPTVGATQACVMEVVLTFLLMFVILNVSTGHKEKGIMAGAAIGATVGIGALIGGPLTGASMNPIRSIAPAVVSGQASGLWIYCVAPIVGAYCAHWTCGLIQGDECCVPTDAESV